MTSDSLFDMTELFLQLTGRRQMSAPRGVTPRPQPDVSSHLDFFVHYLCYHLDLSHCHPSPGPLPMSPTVHSAHPRS